jgi:hypothetical protein
MSDVWQAKAAYALGNFYVGSAESAAGSAEETALGERLLFEAVYILDRYFHFIFFALMFACLPLLVLCGRAGVPTLARAVLRLRRSWAPTRSSPTRRC